MKRLDNDERMSLTIIGSCILTIIALLLLVGTGDGQTLKHHDAPPLKESSCSDTLDTLRFQMWEVSKKEALLFDDRGDHKQADFFVKRAGDVLRTKDLTPSFDSCRVRNIKELNIVVALWHQEYIIDIMGDQK